MSDKMIKFVSLFTDSSDAVCHTAVFYEELRWTFQKNKHYVIKEKEKIIYR